MHVLRERLESRIKEKGLKASPLSLKIGTNHTLIADIINAKSNSPGIDKLISIAKLLDCTVAYLIGETDDPSPMIMPAADAIDGTLLAEAIQLTEDILEETDRMMESEKKANFIRGLYQYMHEEREKTCPQEITKDDLRKMIRVV